MPSNRVEAALASGRPAEQIRAKCSIPTIAQNVKVKSLRVAELPASLPLVSAADLKRGQAEV